jgi:hypothetical protein
MLGWCLVIDVVLSDYAVLMAYATVIYGPLVLCPSRRAGRAVSDSTTGKAVLNAKLRVSKHTRPHLHVLFLELPIMGPRDTPRRLRSGAGATGARNPPPIVTSFIPGPISSQMQVIQSGVKGRPL